MGQPPADAIEGSLARIAAALERIAPPARAAVDWLAHPAYVWQGQGRARELPEFEAMPLAQLRGIEAQKRALSDNLERLAMGAAAHDALLWGARGMGKSALVRACAHHVQTRHRGALGLVQIHAEALDDVPALIAELRDIRRAFLLFVDDLGFSQAEAQNMLALRSLLDGSIAARPAHIRLVVTSNRRAIIAREAQDNAPLHERDERDNALALADRFGLTLGFHPCERATYLEILATYTDPLGLTVDEEEALAWAIARGNRSGRTAYQFACELAGRAGLAL
ncbi:MAG: DUF815 domain-containing protein [Erythrobacter sp.]|nr:DUF815 domain-containing protein [Erythrobacter sp.]